VQQHATLRTNKQRLLTVPGVGPRVALPLLVAGERSHALAGAQGTAQGTAKGVVAYVGLDPQPHESGASSWQRARISRPGDRSLRARLSMGALGALRGDNPVYAFYQRLVARGKPRQAEATGLDRCRTQAARVGLGRVHLGGALRCDENGQAGRLTLLFMRESEQPPTFWKERGAVTSSVTGAALFAQSAAA
jgi:Transposase IS116/IS110/IS902 family